MLNSMVEPGYSIESIVSDLVQHGCESGMIGELIYTRDCVAFYRLYRREIDSMIQELCSDLGSTPDKIFKNWDRDDPFAREDSNQNILAWFGCEETARKLADQNGIEI